MYDESPIESMRESRCGSHSRSCSLDGISPGKSVMPLAVFLVDDENDMSSEAILRAIGIACVRGLTEHASATTEELDAAVRVVSRPQVNRGSE